ncbi:hypothetical protein LTR91_000733 [Friedmanniomyces endolithicus]|uniref:Leo1-like protein n=1 Tax=Friedmanniomyces endolithicus TaxID=329885 RepID=A0AAN6R289_9PEZI|nr:hypothetical protein LTR94_021456 [Friedmanniomyces endolithicus]KAK0769134.1 hypothetical protein LTR59_017211 [Friedmanniomyces endolithicus]KAK0771432.1 hypothetical protein LTR38_017226 [Friedmanniomyces endolithicus]KAK0806959.1 hypothetical protein LTR75_006768 [Friedmanniomyces endolithicus]KAK0858760.1 hypothetical protein LTR03_000185 [Friedmanniomyces endolithicus]
MASAAAVGVNAALSPPRNNIGDYDGIPGEITSPIGRKDDGIEAGEFVEEDGDDDIRGTGRRKGPVVEDAGVEDEDLFGDEDGEPADPPAKRQVDDDELDSADDMDRTDREAEQPQTQTQEQEYETRQQLSMDIEVARQPVPEPSDGEMYLLKMPDFMAIEPQAWSPNSFQPPATDHHSYKAASASFSAYNTALSTMRWRHSPSDPTKLQSNARVLRWSDGSLTLQLASEPTVQYEIDGNPLAPPQRNALKPTPVSVQAASSKGGRQGDGTIVGEKYDQSKDAFTYLAAPNEATSTLRVLHKITAGLSVRQPESGQDDAIERLQAALASAANATKVNGMGSGPAELELIDEDPEEKRREAEKAMKEKAKADKRREAAIQRETDRSNRTLGRSGLSSSRYGAGGLSAGLLEDEDGPGTTRPRKTGASARKSRQRRNSIYSDDEDFGRKHFTSKEDEYDEEDDFVAPSDEEEVVDDEEDPDEGIIDAPSQRERTSKRDREEAPPGGGDDEDAEGEVDDEVQMPKSKRRRVVDEDEDEE